MQYNNTPNKYPYHLIATLCLALAGTLSFAGMAITAKAGPGDLDLTFSGDGKLLDFLSRGDDSARGVAVQPDGKIVVAGSSWTGQVRGSDFAVVRYNTDGSLDATFGTGGRVTTDFGSSGDWASSIAIQQDGKIVAAGASYPGFALVRYNSDGSLDTSFGTNGKVTTDINSGAYSVAIHTDGKIVAAGGNSVARYNTDGSLDTTFDSDGKVTTVFPSRSISFYSVAIHTDGKIVAAGQTYSQSTGAEFALVRYSVDGSLDTSFDGDGLVTTQVGQGGSGANSLAIQANGKIVAAGGANGFGLVRYSSNGTPENVITVQITPPYYYDYAYSVAIQPDGKIVAAGGSSETIAVVRLNANFSIDTTFGTNGRVTTPTGSHAIASGVAVQTDGKIVAAGDSFNQSTGSFDYDYILVRYTTNGSLDTSFDGDGKVTTDSGFFYGNALSDTAIQPDGKIVAAGGARGDFAVLRYNRDGSPDAAFGSGTGKVRTAMGSNDGARAVEIQTNGKIVVAGGTSDYDGNEWGFALARYNVDGSLDPTFGNGGVVFTYAFYGSGGSYDVVIQPDGKIVAAGYDAGNDGGFAVYRYNTDGSLDTSFGGDGTVITPIGSCCAYARSVVLQPDGKIVAAGYSTGYAPYGFIVVRYNGDGSLDPTFDGDGIVTTVTSQGDQVYSSMIQPDGKIIVAGSRSINSNETGFALIRYNGNGSLDTTFGTGGVVTTQMGLHSGAHAVALQPNEKIVASGTSSGIGNSVDFAVVRYNPNGSLDTTFGGDGITTADFDNSTDNAYGLALDNAGRAVVVGGSEGSFALARFLLEPRKTRFDFDGDGKADVSVFRPSDRVWYLNRSTNGFSATQFGLSTDKITPADFDGDGKTDISVYRDGTWYWLKSSNGSFNARHFGIASDIPVPADYTGDGRDELAVYRNGQWWALDLSNDQHSLVNFGLATDKPVAADYDGDGRADQAVYRDGVWYLNRSSEGFTAFPFGLSTDRPVIGDYDGDGRADAAVYRDGTWYLLQSSQGFSAFQWGLSSDIPAPADYDGDGKTDAAVFRDGTWYQLGSTAGIVIHQFGLAGDKPVPSAFTPSL